MAKMKNGVIWKDVSGNLIHAHGGHIIFMEDTIIGMGKIAEKIFISAVIVLAI